MARMNPKRRAALKALALKAQVREIIVSRAKANDDSAKLQQGRVRSSYGIFEAQAPTAMRSIAYRANARPDGFAPSFYKDGARNVYQGNKK